jgi:hypothetical protein
MQNIVAAQATEAGKSGLLPSLSVGTDWTHQMLSKTVSLEHSFKISTDQYQLAGSLSWEADMGENKSNKRAANAAYLQTTAANQAIKTQLIQT